MTIPPPSVLSPNFANFRSWYPGQAEIVSKLLSWVHDKDAPRFLALSAPTGSGKSLDAATLAHMSGLRAVGLTATKGLQDQFQRDFAHISSDIRGMNNYPCIQGADSVEDGYCHSGVQCPYRRGGCSYYDAQRAALRSSWPLTNYDYWLYSEALSEHRDILICDEAHLAGAKLENFLSITLRRHEIERIDPTAYSKLSGHKDWQQWRDWASIIESKVNAEKLDKERQVKLHTETGSRPPNALMKQTRLLGDLLDRVQKLQTSRGQWAWDHSTYGQKDEWRVTPVYPGEYSEALFKGIDKVLLMSACLTPKTMELLGIPEEEYEWLESETTYPAANTPIQHINTVRMDFRTDGDGLRHWVNRIDQILNTRTDRKALIFTASYDRAKFLLSASSHRAQMMTHVTKDVIDQVQRFKQSPPGTIMVSPAITSGWDFPYSECEVIIIGKVPFPDGRTAIMKARKEIDPDWSSFITMELIVQVCGRGTRAEDDRTEVFIVDDHWKWFAKKYQHFAPDNFWDKVKPSTDLIPSPPPALAEKEAVIA